MNDGSMIDTDLRDEVRKEVRSHLTIAVSVLLLLALTVGVSFMGLETGQAIFIALGIAGVQAFLIASFLMHAAGERRIVHLLLAVTAIFLTALIVLTLGTLSDTYGGPSESYGGPSDSAAAASQHDDGGEH